MSFPSRNWGGGGRVTLTFQRHCKQDKNLIFILFFHIIFIITSKLFERSTKLSSLCVKLVCLAVF